MADKLYTLKVIAQGLTEAARGMEELAAAGDKVEKSQGRVEKTNKKHTKSQHEVTKSNKGTSQSTNNTTKAFSKMAQNMEGTLVPAYAAVAANVFALTAAFGALSRAADLQILINASEELATTTGRNLHTVAMSMKELTGEAISLQEAMTNASLAASAGFDNETIEKLTSVARNASVALGRDMTDSLNRIFKGAIKAEPELLDELGIIVRLDKASRDYAASLGKNVKTLTTFEKQTAVVNAVLAEGEKKFDAISKVDVNPYSKLAAAFNDVAISITNFIAIPLTPVIGFLAENVESLTAVLLIFGSSILKTAFPALEKFSETVDTKMKTSVANLQSSIEKLNAYKLSLLPQTEVQKVKSNGEKLKTEFQAIADKYTALGKPIPKGIVNTLKQVTGSAEQANAAMKTLSITKRNIEGGRGSVVGLSASDVDKVIGSVSNLRTSIDNAAKTSLDANKKVQGTFATVATGAANAGIAVTNFGINVVQSSFKSVAAVTAQTTAWGALKEVINQTTLAYKKNQGLASTAFGTAGAAIGGAGAALFKLVPIIGTVTIAWQVLSGAFKFVKNLFLGEDLIKLNESLDKQTDALKDTAKAAKHFQTNLAELPDTLDNVNKKLTLQNNLLTEMTNNLKEVVEDIDLQGGFDRWDQFLDYFNAGDLDIFKESVEELADQLKRLGYAKEVIDFLEDFDDISGMGKVAAKDFGEQLLVLSTNLQRAAAASKSAHDTILTNATALEKSLTDMDAALPALTDAEETFLGLAGLVAQLDTASAEKFVSVFTSMSDLSLERLGLTELAADAADAEAEVEALTTQIEALTEVQDKLTARQQRGTGATRDNQTRIDELSASIEFLEGRAEIARGAMDLLADSMKVELAGALKIFEDLTKAQQDFALASSKLKFEISINSGAGFEERKAASEQLFKLELDQIGKLTKANLDTIKLEENAKRSASSRISNLNVDAVGLEKTGSKYQEIDAKRILNQEAITKSEKKITQLKKANFQNQLNYLKALEKQTVGYQKELFKVLTLQESGLTHYENQEAFLRGKFRETLIEIQEARSATPGEAAAFADARIQEINELHRLRKVLYENSVLSEKAAVSRFMASKESINNISNEIGMSRLLKDETSERLSEELSLMNEIAQAESAIGFLETQEAEFAGNDAALEELERTQSVYRDLISELQDEALAVVQQAAYAKYTSGAKQLKVLKDQNKYGGEINKYKKQEIAYAKILEKYDRLKEGNLLKLLKLEKNLNKERNRNEYLNALKDSAIAMNDLADAMEKFQTNQDNDQFNGTVNAMILMQSVGEEMGGAFGDMTKGLATVSLAFAHYGETVNASTEGMTAQEVAQRNNNAAMNLAMNSAGAMAGAFKEGSDAAKAFTLIQQGLAVASAAAAVAQAAQLPPPAGFATAAAMLSLMASVLGFANIAFGGGGGDDASGQKAAYDASFGNDSLQNYELQGGKSFTESMEELVATNTAMYSVSRDLQISIKHLNETMDRLGVVLFSALSGTSGAFSGGPAPLIGITSEEISGLDFSSIDGFVNSVFDEISSAFSGRTDTAQYIEDTGIALQATFTSGIAGLDAFFTQLSGRDLVKYTEDSHGAFGTNSKHKEWYDFVFTPLSDEVVQLMNDALNQTADVVNNLVGGVVDGLDNINLQTLFSQFEGEIFGAEFVRLFELDDEEIPNALAEYFTSVTDDVLKSALPFIEKYQKVGEGFTDTLIRMNIETNKLNDVFKLTNTSLADYTAISVSAQDIQDKITRDLNKTFSSRLFGGILTSIYQKVTEANIESGAYDAMAEQFKVEAAAAWKEAYLKNFKDLDEALELEDSLFNTILSDAELAQNTLDRTGEILSEGFTKISDKLISMGESELAANLLSATNPIDALHDFYIAAEQSDLFDIAGDFATGTFDTAGAELRALLVELGQASEEWAEATSILESLLEKIDSLNESYIQQIALFGLLGKELELLELAFDFNAAIKEAEETGSDIGAVEVLYGLKRLEIIKDSYEEINNAIEEGMASVYDSIVDLSKNLNFWDDIAYATIKINKLVDRLKKGSTTLNIDSLLGDTSEFTDFMDNFSSVIDGLSTDAPTSVTEEIALVEDLRSAIIDRYELETALLQDQTEMFKGLSTEINNFLDDLIISDQSPLTNFERLGEATSQFLDNAADIFSEDPEVAENASANLLDSASSLLEIASQFYAIGPEYTKIFDLVSDTLTGIDEGLLNAINNPADPLVTLAEDTLVQLEVLDSILAELSASNEDTYFMDIANAVTDGMLPILDQVTTKLDSIDDGSWTTMIGLLDSINTAVGGTLMAIDAGALNATVNDTTGETSMIVSPSASFEIGTPEVPYDMVAQIHKGETIVPESMAQGLREGTLTLGNPQDNSDVVEAIRELTGVLAISQEDIVEATNRNVAASMEISQTMDRNRQQVKTKGIV